ncbi:MAG: 23S rRNA (uracil(1939)-C(5))-methyltransferase, partial [Xanthomonadales bacterium]|nr:23S rRNA (uracil(1939)-C(5))-methyltransferase [Xanthomonadales bacterium]
MAARRKLPPEPFETTIERVLDNGRGLASHEDRRLEVHDALPGERVQARYLFGRRFRGQAQAVAVLEPSASRTEPRCPHFGTCSACVLQHMDAAAQLEFKQSILLRQLNEAGLAPARVLAPLAADAWNYRRKARLSVRYVKKKER